ncbi:hypothetical protein ABW19_dt0208269 [Dactylella cylindrospora]|nr:hypothetical protein ABW19_dt0208269 [Dactylella cylindrospora]
MSRRQSTRQQHNPKKDSDIVTVEINGSDAEDALVIKASKPSKTSRQSGVKAFYTQEEREKSFAVTGARKRQSNPKKGSKAQKWTWPSDHPHPELMAKAGFYFKPAQGDEDNVACFLCQKNMSEWDPEDDPAEQHVRHNNSCGWALTMCRELVVDGEIASDPLGEEMHEARRMTFDAWWPHEGKKGWKPTVENVIMAGFIFRPLRDGDDTVYCPYCKLSIDEWEQNDDPREVHKSLGSGDCAFMKHIETMESRSESKQDSAASDDVEPAKDKSGPKKKATRTRKTGSTAQRKKNIPKSSVDPEEYQDMIFQGGEIKEDEVEPKKASRGKKRGSSVMEEGGRKPLFAKDDRAAKVFQEQQQYIEEQETPRKPPAKRRVTRASIATNQSELDLIVSIPTHLAHGSDDEGVGTISLHNTPVKPKGKGRKKATRASTASSKGGKGKKQAASKEPLDFAGMDDEEIDRALELDIMGGNISDDDKENEFKGHNEEIEISEVKEKEPAPELAKETTRKGTRRLTRTKPVHQESPTPEPEPVEKPRRKRLTRTKPPTRVSVEAPPSPALESPPASPIQPPSLSPPAEVQDEAKGLDDRVDEPSAQEAIVPSVSPTLEASADLDTQEPAVPQVDEPVAEPEVVEKVVKEPAPKRGRPSRKISSAQAAAGTTNSASALSSGAKDMKRKSDAVVDNEQDGPSGKKRRTTKSLKGLKASKGKGNNSVPAGPKQSKIKDGKTSQEPQAPVPAVIPQKLEVGDSSRKSKTEEETAPTVTKPSPELPTTSDEENHVEEDTIIDGVEEAAGQGEMSQTSGDKTSESEDNEANATTGKLEGAKETISKSKVSASHVPAAQDQDSPVRSQSPAFTASQDSVPNTQFSAVASQATMASSFQSSNKGVSFVTTAEEQLLAEQEASFAKEEEEEVEKSLVVSPKATGTPLSVLSKPHNGALALMTPRHRADDITFAPVQSMKPWKSADVEVYLDDLKENNGPGAVHSELSSVERKMTAAQWIKENAKRAEKRLVHNGELLVKFFESETLRAIAAIEAIETDSE